MTTHAIRTATLLTAGILLASCGGADTATTPEDVPATGMPAPDQRDGHEPRLDREPEGNIGAAITPATGYEDPVCRMTVAPEANQRHTHDGVTYGFCSGACKRAFSEDPDAFLVALEE